LEGDLDDLDVVVVLTLDRGVYDMLLLLLFGLSLLVCKDEDRENFDENENFD
jgi:hypothetical protein